MSRHYKKQTKTISGQTIVEVMIAIALLGATVMSTTRLVRQLLQTNTAAGQRSQASALATEQMELLRSFRDQRVAVPNGWEQIMPPGSSCRTFVMEEDSGQPQLVVESDPQRFSTDSDSHLFHYERLIEACPSREYSVDTNTYQSSTEVISVEVMIYWENARSDDNETVYRSYLSDWSRE